MKKLFILGIIVALVAALVVPMATFAAPPAPTTTSATGKVGGTLAEASVSFTAPSAITLGSGSPASMAGGWNTATSDTPGKVTVAGLGGKLSSNWTVTAQGATNMTISGGSTPLTNPLLISTSIASGTTWYAADGTSTAAVGAAPDTVVTPAAGPLTYTSNATMSLPFAAAQYIVAADNTAGDYSDTITFTLSYTP